MARPGGKPPLASRTVCISLTERDKQLVDWFCQVMGVGYSECFRILLNGAFDLAREANENAARPMEEAKS